jgi:phospholipase/lecithinase/hemolysin
MRNLTLLALCLTLFLLRVSYGQQRLVVFGDSLSDIGNSFALTNRLVPLGPPAGAYGETFDPTGPLGPFLGRFTDGQNWVDYFPGIAQQFGVHISPVTAYQQNPSNDSATDFAVGGATSADLNVINGALGGLLSQISNYGTYIKSHGNAANDLCVIWIGANDFDFSAQIKPADTVANIEDAIAKLSRAGAKNFVVATLPDIALTPRVKAAGGPTVLAATQFVVTTNVLLAVELPRFAFAHQISIDLVDINAVFMPLVLSPGSFGFTNSSGAAYNPTLPLSSSNPKPGPNQYVFWDDFHPTTNVHRLAAAFIFSNIFLSRQIHPFLSLR